MCRVGQSKLLMTNNEEAGSIITETASTGSFCGAQIIIISCVEPPFSAQDFTAVTAR